MTNVTQETCSRHRWRMIGTFLTVLGMGAFLVTWAVTKGYTAEKRASQVDTKLQVHEAAQKTHEKHLHATPDRLENMQERILDKVANGT